jgi:3-(3-hydroxy-phenyl)propionate hydroxylase
VRVLVLEAEPEGRERPGQRAIGFFFPTLRRWEAVLPGPGEPIATAGLQVRGYVAYYGRKRVFTTRFKPAPPMR